MGPTIVYPTELGKFSYNKYTLILGISGDISLNKYWTDFIDGMLRRYSSNHSKATKKKYDSEPLYIVSLRIELNLI